MKSNFTTLAALLAFLGGWLQITSAAASPSQELRKQVRERVEAEYPSLEEIYRNLHAHPELSFMEVKTAALVARELRSLGFTVTEKVGNTGVVGVLTNGSGPTLLVRADMDGLPVRETSGVPICMWFVGASNPAAVAESDRTGVPLPSNHSPTFAPVAEPTLKACVVSMTAAVVELLRR